VTAAEAEKLARLVSASTTRRLLVDYTRPAVVSSLRPRSLIAALIAAAGFAFLLGFTAPEPEASPPPFRIGAAAPFSGQEGAAVYGENIKNGVELAIEEINARGGVKGHNLTALYEDDQLQASVSPLRPSKSSGPWIEWR
jgi:ABC-type branched-subunit amino acid transport system substrate-binding protein